MVETKFSFKESSNLKKRMHNQTDQSHIEANISKKARTDQVPDQSPEISGQERTLKELFANN